jgi:CheY-like chemotaxis protein
MAGEKILVVEDNDANMLLTTDVLMMAGYQVVQAMTAEEGIEVARSEQPNLILMDVSLPGMDGLEAAAALKADPTTAGIPIVALTAYAMKGDRERMLAAGCDGYISKPIDIPEFIETVGGYLAGKRPEEA